ncbi:MAG: ribosome recycling factor [Patescibacteria group bacterium]
MNPAVTDFKKHTEQALLHLKEDLKSIRTGRATPALIENMPVETYGGQTTLRLMELATIGTSDPSTLSIQPFDSSVQQDIEKAILKSALGLTPSTQGHIIIVKIPPLSQEQREKYIKLLGQKIEEKRNNVRNFRDDARRKVKHQLEKKEINEDQRFRVEKEIDSLSQSLMEDIQAIKEAKEKEIMQV